MRETTAWMFDDTGRGGRRTTVARRDLRDDDVAVRIDFCGVCHTDVHSIDGLAAGGSVVPGHEFTGTVVAVGDAVSTFRTGDTVAVGNIVDSCGICAHCRAGQENWCHEFPTLTYGGTDRRDGSTTAGAYAREYVVREGFCHPLPDGLDPAAAAPLLCAGVTVWEPLRAAGVDSTSRVAVAGLGGLGHLAVKFAVALGARTTVISRSADKAEDARALGADDLLVSTDEERMAAARDTFDVVIDTISAEHQIEPYLRVTAVDGVLVQLGHLGPMSVDTLALLVGRKRLSSSGSGGLRSTREMLAFCGEHGVLADVDVVPSAEVDAALSRVRHNDVRYRMVLDMSDLDMPGVHGEVEAAR
ncbi:NAD(P)-dependent alcohol dehydrogenase [Williamsia deligens]|uniref:alcohol dehydrogenase (NADP(+)) n=1 Tax=Williamsia deligens TaxID=321325 RepID=A0ABW3G2H0_9NOCA|nr:NAD(P)-dependent alcohol dehydrogenase [Williamsia deligens]MCP2194348.1 putative zinc-type alcohol dehydrogenase-like protein [Williamsia deligens]